MTNYTEFEKSEEGVLSGQNLHPRVREALPWLIRPNVNQQTRLLFLVGSEKTFRTEVSVNHLYTQITDSDFKPLLWKNVIGEIVFRARESLDSSTLRLYTLRGRGEIRLDEDYPIGTTLMPYIFAGLIGSFTQKTDQETALKLAALMSVRVERVCQLTSFFRPEEEDFLACLASYYPEVLPREDAIKYVLPDCQNTYWRDKLNNVQSVLSRLRSKIGSTDAKDSFEIETLRSVGYVLVTK